MTAFDEEALLLTCGGEQMLGVFTLPARITDATVAVLVVVGGPQYRVGSHRQFVHLARALGSGGHVVLRFDARGMGDGTGAQRSFEGLGEDIAVALEALTRRAPTARRVALFGLCDGASAALLYLHESGDRRVTDLCVLNPWARSEATLARTHLKHYYTRRLADPDFWRKLLAGGVGWARLREFVASLRAGFGRRGAGTAAGPVRLPFQQAMARAWRGFEGRILLALSSEDLTAREFVEHASTAPDWHGLLAAAKVQRLDLAGADHTLSEPAARQALEAAMLRWLGPAAS